MIIDFFKACLKLYILDERNYTKKNPTVYMHSYAVLVIHLDKRTMVIITWCHLQAYLGYTQLLFIYITYIFSFSPVFVLLFIFKFFLTLSYFLSFL